MTPKCSVKRAGEPPPGRGLVAEAGAGRDKGATGGSSAGGESGLTGSASLAQRALNFHLKLLTCWYF